MGVALAEERPKPVCRLPRAQRREQILAAATEAFARSGFAATGLDDIAAKAGVTRVILYRHFDSKTDLYLGGPGPHVRSPGRPRRKAGRWIHRYQHRRPATGPMPPSRASS